MKLTNKCLIDFWKWYLLPDQRKDYKTNSLRGNDSVVKLRFLAMSFIERFGVYVDFFDSVEIDIGVVRNRLGTFNSWCSNYDEFDIQTRALPTQDSRLKARIKAIEKANEIYNNL